MKRDMDLARKILLEVQDSDRVNDLITVEIAGYSRTEINYHIELLEEAGYIKAINTGTSQDPMWFPLRLTSSGHDFIEAAKDETRWNKAKAIVLEKGGGLVFDVLKGVLLELMKNQIRAS